MTSSPRLHLPLARTLGQNIGSSLFCAYIMLSIALYDHVPCIYASHIFILLLDLEVKVKAKMKTKGKTKAKAKAKTT